LCIK